MKIYILFGIVNISYANIIMPVENPYSSFDTLNTNKNYSINSAFSYYNQDGANNYGGGINLYYQTPTLYNFKLGSFLTLMNPYSNYYNPSQIEEQALGLSIKEQVAIQELFLEYNLNDAIKVDIGDIGVSNSPWLTFYQNNAFNLITYRGAMLNIKPNEDLLITFLALDKSMLLGENTYYKNTYYNTIPNRLYLLGIGGYFDYSTTFDQALDHTYSIGINFDNDNINYRVWWYEFGGYSNLLYTDITYKTNFKNIQINYGIQSSKQFGSSFTNNNYNNNVNSNMIGASIDTNYKNNIGITLAYNNIWGLNNSFLGGNIISPYTFSVGTDPLFTTSWIGGLIEKSAGYSYKISPYINLLNNQLNILLSYANYQTYQVIASQEYDIVCSISPQSLKGLNLILGYGYISHINQIGYQEGQFMLSYTY